MTKAPQGAFLFTDELTSMRLFFHQSSITFNSKLMIKIMEELNENDISYKIRGAIFEVYNELGPGLFESSYQAALLYQLKKDGLDAQPHVEVNLEYDNVTMNIGYKMDILVNDKVVVEIKSVEKLTEVHHKQLITYLKLSGKKLGLLVNFNSAEIDKSIFRKVNGL
jgi:GxxExxY protein